MNIDDLRAKIEARRAEILALHQTEDGELREFTPEDQETYDRLRAEDAADVATLTRHEEIQAAAELPERTVEQKLAPAVHVQRDAMEVINDNSSSRSQRVDTATRLLEEQDVEPENLDHVRKVLKAHAGDRTWANSIIARSTDDYVSAWLKMIQGREFELTTEERTVLGVTTSANGKYLLPTHLDPTIILTSALSTNEIRKISRVVTLVGAPAWNGVTSAGVSASWDGEVVEVSDDSPTFGQPSITTTRAQALVQASISAVEDIADLGSDVMMMFADAKDRLEGAAHATGTGSSQPEGIFHAINAVSGDKITSGTAATIALADLNALYTGLPLRYRRNATWVANPLYTVAIKALGTAVSAAYSGQLADGTPEAILKRPVVESDDAPSTQTTTVLDQEVLLGDFSQYVVVDRPGGMSVEYIPHLFNTSNNLPDGRRAWYATWRNGAGCVNTDAFRLLVDKTSA